MSPSASSATALCLVSARCPVAWYNDVSSQCFNYIGPGPVLCMLPAACTLGDGSHCLFPERKQVAAKQRPHGSVCSQDALSLGALSESAHLGLEASAPLVSNPAVHCPALVQAWLPLSCLREPIHCSELFD